MHISFFNVSNIDWIADFIIPNPLMSGSTVKRKGNNEMSSLSFEEAL